MIASYLGKRSFKGFSCIGGYQPASVVSAVLISVYSAIRRNSSANMIMNADIAIVVNLDVVYQVREDFVGELANMMAGSSK